MTPEERLERAFAADQPPARDYAFTAAVMQRVARRRLQVSLVLLVPPLLAAVAVLWALAPVIEPFARDLFSGVEHVVPVLVLTLFLTAAAFQLLPRKN